MSTDDSISEDVSSSGALSHSHVSADRDGGKGSEASLVSSEGTSASGLAVSEDRNVASQTTGDTVESRPMDVTPACNKIRSLCLSTEEAFKQGKNLPFINPSSLETLRALVQEIQNSGETDPQIWKDCEGRWLHLFQLVEKQYQEQILAQQEQYQCQIQLIQDEIKALVQLQNRQPSVQPHTEFSPASVIKTTADTNSCNFPLMSGDWTIPRNLSSNNDSLAAPGHTPFSSPSPPLQRSETANQVEKRVAKELSSGYGTLSASEMCLEPAWSPEEDRDGSQEREKHHRSSKFQETTVTGCQQDLSSERTVEEDNTSVFRLRTSGSNSQPLTSWAQRQKLRPKKSTKGHASSQTPVHQGQTSCPKETCRQIPAESTDFQAQHRPAGLSSSSIPLRRSDSLISEASGLTYWRLNEHELYRPLPDSFDSGAYLCLQEASGSLPQSQECWLSLREIYQNKQRADCKHSDWEASVMSSPSSPQVLSLDPAVNTRQSDCTSGFTSPSHFSSQSFHNHPHLNHRIRTPISPDSIVDCSPRPGDIDFISDSSSVSVTRPSPNKVQNLWGNASQTVLSSSPDNTQPCSDTANQQRTVTVPFASEEEDRHTHTSTQKPCIASGANLQPLVSPHMERASSVEDPVVLSVLRQNLREKHSRHVADLKAYYESEIQILREKLKLRGLPQDLQKSNHALTERCKHLERALGEANSRIEELEATNCLLEKKMADWAERYAVAAATVKSLQTRLEESKCSAKEKDTLAIDLKTHIQQLEEAALKACQEANEKKAKMEREHQTLQDFLGEYDSLIRQHEEAKNKLVSVENKLVDANDHISELKRVISKLESQVKQLEHENQTRARYTSHSKPQSSGAGLFHHPDLLLSPSKSKAEPDITSRKSPCLLTDQMNCDRKNICPQTNQSGVHKKSLYASSDQSSGPGSSVDTSSAAGSWRCASPPECEQSLPQTRQQQQSQWETSQTQTSGAHTPMMRALIELEETRATESRAPWVGSQRTTVGFLERRQKELIQERVGLKTGRKVVQPGGTVVGVEQGGATKSLSGHRRAAALLGSLSPESQRSSSLPPPAQRNLPTTSPRKRDTLLLPKSAKSSPKRCPTENYSTAFGHMMPREEHLIKRFNGKSVQRHHSLHSSSPRKRLQFTSTDKEDDRCPPSSSGSMNPSDESSQLGWEEQEACGSFDLQDFSSLAEAEKLFDELTQEKLQIEAALSRMPGAGGRQSLQTRLDEVALDNRLERLNRELGAIRMTLKRFNILRCSANV